MDDTTGKTTAPAVEGWFTIDDEPALVGTRCRACGSVYFPPLPAGTALCRNPRCPGTELDETRLSRRGRVWSYTDARYQPPPPYIPRRDPYEPFALAAVELAEEGIIVLGQVADGYGPDDLTVDTPVELVVEPLYEEDGTTYVTWRWAPAPGGDTSDASDPAQMAAPRGSHESASGGTGGDAEETRPTLATPPVTDTAGAGEAAGLRPSGGSAERDVVVLGVGMHPWGKWGRSFVSYGTHAAQAALADAGIDWSDVQLMVGGETVRNGYAGYVAGSTFAQALGWNGARVATSYAACATGAQALDVARTRILAGLTDVALVVGADTTPKGFLAPNAGERRDDPDWLRFRLLGMTNPGYFALYARRRMAVHGATPDDFALVKVKNARHGLANPNARYRKAVSHDEVLASPVVADPLHLLDICATSDGGAAVVLASRAAAQRHGIDDSVRLRAVSTVTPTFPNAVIEMPNFATDPATAAPPPERTFRDSIAHAAYEEAGLGPEDMSLAEVYDLSTALELDWYENIGLCKPGEAERMLRDGDTTIGGRIPVNPSGGLACFGEAVPAQALAQVCEVVEQLRGRATGRQVDGARAGITANQGLFGHGSSVILSH